MDDDSTIKFSKHRTKREPWLDWTRVSAATAVANRPKPGRHREFESDDDDEAEAARKPFDRRVRFPKREAR